MIKVFDFESVLNKNSIFKRGSLMFHTKWVVQLIFILTVLFTGESIKRKSNYHYAGRGTTSKANTKTMCINVENTLRARHKSCFLRPDTGPCRADILQWYFDVKQKKCYRFFWGGCQGNGNRFETNQTCLEYCFLDEIAPSPEIPQFCSLAFDYGTCFGHYERWAWDPFSKTCKKRLYSGCGGNQNNFEEKDDCIKVCLTGPNNTLHRFNARNSQTTCIPLDVNKLT